MPYSKEELEASGIDAVTITPGVAHYGEPKEQHEVYAHGTYPDSSVLAGQYRRVCLAVYSTLQEAQEAYPWAEVQGGLLPASWVAPRVPQSPPAWFDPADAGENWSEEDY